MAIIFYSKGQGPPMRGKIWRWVFILTLILGAVLLWQVLRPAWK
jgi:hypothetical protein